MRVEARLQRASAIIVGGEACDGYERRAAVFREQAQSFGQLVAVHARHAYVGNYNVEVFGASRVKRFVSRIGHHRVITCMAKKERYHLGHVRRVVNYERTLLSLI